MITPTPVLKHSITQIKPLSCWGHFLQILYISRWLILLKWMPNHSFSNQSDSQLTVYWFDQYSYSGWLLNWIIDSHKWCRPNDLIYAVGVMYTTGYNTWHICFHYRHCPRLCAEIAIFIYFDGCQSENPLIMTLQSCLPFWNIIYLSSSCVVAWQRWTR